MRNYRKTLAGIAAIAMLLNTAPAAIPQMHSMLSVAVSAAEEESVFTYESNGTSITITGVQADARNIIIPETIDGLPVTSIVEDAFAACDQLETLSLPASITAFCIDNICVLSVKGTLRDVIWQGTLPQWQDAIYNIDLGVPALSARLHIPADGIVLGVYDTYYHYISYTEENYVVIDGVANTEYELPITELVIPDEIDGVPVRDIAPYAFQWQTGITSVTLPESIRTIGARAFMNCGRLETVVMPSKMLMGSIGESAFAQCTALKNITLPKYVTFIGAQAFSGCEALTEITWSVPAEMNAGVFSGCSSLTTVHLDDSIEEIPQNAFSGCISLMDVYYSNTQDKWNQITISSGNEALTAAALHCAGVMEGVYENLTYRNISDNYIVITGLTEDAGDVTELVIPKSIDGIPVEEIADSAFAGNESLTSVTLPDSIHRIGDYAFQDCLHLTDCDLPAQLNRLGKYAFQNCVSLRSISTPLSLTVIPEGCFSGCISLTTALLNPPVGTIEAEAFKGCEALSALHLSNFMHYIGPDAFLSCPELTDIYYGGTEKEWDAFAPYIASGNPAFKLDTTTIHYSAVTEATAQGLTYYKYWDHVEIIDADPSITKADIPAEIDDLPVIAIAASAFEDCTLLESVTIPDSVTAIGNFAFRNCTSLKSIVIPESVTTFRSAVFDGCTSLTEAVIEAPITVLGHSVFAGCENLVNVALPDTITSFGFTAFAGCKSLVSIDLPDGLTYLPDGAFYNCSSLREIDLPDTMTNIGSNVFNGCTSMTEINIPAKVTNIGWSAFGNSGIAAINVDAANTTFMSIDGVLFSKDGTYIRSYPSGKKGAYTIPDGVLVVDRMAFMDAQGLTSVTVSETVVTLMEESFKNCTALEEVNIPATLEAIYGNVFKGCTALESINVAEDSPYFKDVDGMLIDLEYSRLLHCPAMAEGTVTVTDDIKQIGSGAFASCTGVTEVVLPDGLIRIFGGAFSGCTGLKSIVIPDSVTEIQDGAFMDCTNLESVILPAGEDSISMYAFERCTSLKEVTIPASIDYINVGAFLGCEALTTVNYGGTQAQWDEITIKDGNECLLNAEILVAEGQALGDLDNDGEINTTDAALLLMDAATEGATGISNLNAAQKAAADVNGDGIRNATDASLILHYAAYLGTGGTDSLEDYLKNFNV